MIYLAPGSSTETTTFYDCNGIPICAYDVLKVYHFTDSRQRKHYMYKWVIERDGRLWSHHLQAESDRPAYLLTSSSLENAEIVQGYNCVKLGQDFTDRPRLVKKR